MTQSLLILPFRNLSLSTEDEFLSDGITEELISTLTRQPHLKVASRTSSFYFKQKNFSLDELKDKLDVSHLLEGSIRRAGKNIRITVNLTEVATGFTQWSEKFDLEYNDLLSVQDDIACSISRKFSPEKRVDEGITQAVPKGDVTAYEYYLKALYHYHRYTMDEFRKAAEWCEKAIRRQPDFALAYGLLAHLHCGLGGYVHPSHYRQCREFATRALALDDKNLMALFSMAFSQMFYDWDWEGAERILPRIFELAPRSSLVHRTRGVFFQVTGQMEKAIESHELATKYDPLDPVLINGLGRVLFMSGRYEDAKKEYERALNQDPSFRPALEDLGMVNMVMGDWEEAERNLLRYQQMCGHPLKGWFGLGYAYGKMGRVEEAYEVLERLNKRKEELPQETLDLDFAMVFLGLGKLEQTFAYLNNAVDKHHIYTMATILASPIFDELKSDERYLKLLQKLGLDKYHQKEEVVEAAQVVQIQSDTKEHLELVLDHLLYVEADGNYSRFVWREGQRRGERLLRLTLAKVMTQLSGPGIMQIHRSFVANLSNMESLTKIGRAFQLENPNYEVSIPVSRNKGAEVANHFKALRG